jgi:N6-L-threonylcarbamoyladenine synthase
VADICASFQTAIVATLQDRLKLALGRFLNAYPDIAEPTLVVAGGVAANGPIRAALQSLCGGFGFRFVAPPVRLCGDNGVMIAWAGVERLAAGLAEEDWQGFAPRSRWPLDIVSAPVVGSGRRGAKA